jgi:hypothetical protein
VSSRTRRLRCLGITQELSVDHVGQPSLQTPQRFFAIFPGGAFAQLIVPARAVALDLADGHGVQATVQLTVPSPGAPVTDDVAGGNFDRGGAGVGGERRFGAEAGDVSDSGDNLVGGGGARCAACRR